MSSMHHIINKCATSLKEEGDQKIVLLFKWSTKKVVLKKGDQRDQNCI